MESTMSQKFERVYTKRLWYFSVDEWKKDLQYLIKNGYDISTGTVEHPFIIVYNWHKYN
jgi:hypothetical protein